MAACTACGEQNPEGARFCVACGAALPEPTPGDAQSRRLVTILFADVTDSTALGERLDPETLRRVMARYFEEMRAVLERHGGTVEKFIGDAVMAVFGIPHVHEDDALRAVRAAGEMRERLAALNEELGERGIRISMRTGVNTGEVVAGDVSAGALVTGDAVNVAKRLEQAAHAGEVLLGELTGRLVRDATLLEPVEPLAVKGKAEPLTAWRLLAVVPGAPTFPRRLDAPLVGRRAELDRLLAAFATAVDERRPHLVTVLGAAGIGKSRLAAELFSRLRGEATILVGRCLPYGDGITFWPLRQIVRTLGGEDGVRAAVAASPEADLIAHRLRAAVAATDEGGGSEETFWAVRKLFEELARERPVVVCVEDVHWAEPTLLELLEYVAGWTRSAPLLLLCLARPELHDVHPAWPPRELGTVTVPLEPLTASEADTLLAELDEADVLSGEARVRITEAAGGNPLFVEQLAAALAEHGEELAFPLPPSLHALLAARLDRLPTGERALLERAAVAGKEFRHDAVAHLSPADERPALASGLLALVRRGLVRPEPSPSLGDDGFVFRHVLIRDAAYAGMPKRRRADLHEHFAVWLERSADETDVDEILGYHLEQAYRLRAELAPVDEHARELAGRAGDVLGRAGRRAYARDDMPAALKLLDRAVALLTREDPAYLELGRELSAASFAVGEVARAEALLAGLIEAAAAAGDRRQEWYGLLESAARRRMTDTAASDDELLTVAQDAVAVFEKLGDDVGLARAWRRVAIAHQAFGRYGASAEAAERAVEHARRAASAQEESRSTDMLCTSLLYGPTPARDAIARCRLLLERADRNPLLEANILSSLVGLLGMDGSFEEARAHADRARAVYDELGLRLARVGLDEIAGGVELLAGETEAAERELRAGYEVVATAGGPALAAMQAIRLAEALLAQDRVEEAARLSVESGAALGERDTVAQVYWRTLQASVDARRGEAAGAERLAREAVELASASDDLNMQGVTLAALGDVLAAAGDQTQAAEARRAALERFGRKGNAVASRRLAALVRDAVPG
jgi:class 3 adenylate cyclase/tetratricopeptide (TPR) repeat protein